MFVPGNRQRFVDKALATGADASGVDAVFLDLEDGVPFPEKPVARTLVPEALGRAPGGPLRFVRVNAVGTDAYREDLDAILVPGLDGVCAPKVEAPAGVEELAAALDAFEARAGLPEGTVRIVAAIESAVGLLAAPAIAAAHPRMLGVMLGAEDYALDLGLGTEREGEARELQYARSTLVVAAAAARILAIDGVFPNLDDEEGLRRDIVQARRLGFAAKSTFNPRQVALINRVFSPTADEVEYARSVTAAFEAAQARGDGSVAVGGQLVDRPIVLRAQRILDLVEAETSVGSASEEARR
jgi:citrate lyase subunit beta/citryl-CoA lyase